MDAVADSTGALPDSQGRYLNSRRHEKTNRRRTLNHRVRLAAKRYTEDHPDQVPCRTHRLQGVECKFANRNFEDHVYRTDTTQDEINRYQQDRQDPSRLRHHAEHDIRTDILRRNENRRAHAPVRACWRADRPRAPRATEEDDGIALARSRDPLPSDRNRNLQRTPSLEREEAFCDAQTFKGKVHVKPMLNVAAADDDTQVAELYRMGLLYDESEQRQRANAAFNLNDIQHDEPVYSIRPARRGRRTNKSRGYDGPLPLELSFADLGTDDDLAQFLVSPSASEAETAGDDSLQHSSRRASRQTSAPLRVIYELATARPSFDVDTSQPPDLMNDSLSDYDCFSDSELDDDAGDVPSQREVHDAAAATSTSGPWVLLGDDS